MVILSESGPMYYDNHKTLPRRMSVMTLLSHPGKKAAFHSAFRFLLDSKEKFLFRQSVDQGDSAGDSIGIWADATMTTPKLS